MILKRILSNASQFWLNSILFHPKTEINICCTAKCLDFSSCCTFCPDKSQSHEQFSSIHHIWFTFGSHSLCCVSFAPKRTLSQRDSATPGMSPGVDEDVDAAVAAVKCCALGSSSWQPQETEAKSETLPVTAATGNWQVSCCLSGCQYHNITQKGSGRWQWNRFEGKI